MRRREFIMLLGGAATWPLAARAQGRVFRIGYLGNLSLEATPELLGAFRNALRARGYVEGQNLTIFYRWAPELSESIAVEVVGLNPDVIVAWGSPAVAVARQATSTIPIVMVGIADPIAVGFVASLSRPGRNITGTTNISRDLSGKLLELLAEVVPALTSAGVLWNPRNPGTTVQLREIEAANRTLGWTLTALGASTADELDNAFVRMKKENVKAVVVVAEPFFISQRALIANLARGARLPTIFARRENVEAGGLMSYGPSLITQFDDTANYVDKILKGASPSELPVQQPTKFELVINLKTAKALGLTIPPTLLTRADEVIE
jgi:putative tryptophan/tyrosine transport system substrate-binding protein